MAGRVFFERTLQLAGITFDCSHEGRGTTRAEALEDG